MSFHEVQDGINKRYRKEKEVFWKTATNSELDFFTFINFLW